MTRAATALVVARRAAASACSLFRPSFFQRLIVHCQRRASALSVQAPASFRMPSTSSLSRMLNCCFRPTRSPSLAQDAHAERVEGADDQVLRGARPDQRLRALAHLLRRLVREGDRGDLPRRVAGLQQPRDLVRDHAGLARAGAGQHQARARSGGAPPPSARRSATKVHSCACASVVAVRVQGVAAQAVGDRAERLARSAASASQPRSRPTPRATAGGTPARQAGVELLVELRADPADGDAVDQLEDRATAARLALDVGDAEARRRAWRASPPPAARRA